jgi:hypothetical protein
VVVVVSEFGLGLPVRLEFARVVHPGEPASRVAFRTLSDLPRSLDGRAFSCRVRYGNALFTDDRRFDV